MRAMTMLAAPVVVAMLGAASLAQGVAEARIGEIREVEGPRYVGYTERGKVDFREQYVAPPNWYILDTKPHSIAEHGNRGWGISTLPGDSHLLEVREIREKYDSLIDYAEKKGDQEYATKLKEELDSYIKTRSLIQSSHNIVVLSGWIREQRDSFGIRRARGHVNLESKVRIVRFLSPDELESLIASHSRTLGRP